MRTIPNTHTAHRHGNTAALEDATLDHAIATDAKREARLWRIGAEVAIVLGLVAGIIIGLTIHASAPHDASHPAIPLCDGCGYEVTTYYPNHDARTVNYFSTGGQQVTWSGVWVQNDDSENKAAGK